MSRTWLEVGLIADKEVPIELGSLQRILPLSANTKLKVHQQDEISV